MELFGLLPVLKLPFGDLLGLVVDSGDPFAILACRGRVALPLLVANLELGDLVAGGVLQLVVLVALVPALKLLLGDLVALLVGTGVVVVAFLLALELVSVMDWGSASVRGCRGSFWVRSWASMVISCCSLVLVGA